MSCRCPPGGGPFKRQRTIKEGGMDDYLDDFDDDPGDGFIENEFDDDLDDIFDGEMDENETLCDNESVAGIQDRNWNGLEWQDWMIIGPLSEDIAREKREKKQIERDMFGHKDQEKEDW